MKDCQAKNPEFCRYHGAYHFPAEKLSYVEHVRESEKLKMFLTIDERDAVQGYLEQEYMELNAHLHGAEINPSPETLKRIKDLDAALDKYEPLRPQNVITTYRATKCYQSFTDRTEAQKWIRENFPVKSKIKLAGFTSTTPNPSALFDFLPESHADLSPTIGGPLFPTKKDWDEYLQEEPDRGLGNLVFVLKTRAGVPVSGYGQAFSQKEQEYLFPRDKEFTVDSILPYRKILNPDDSSRRQSAHATVITLKES